MLLNTIEDLRKQIKPKVDNSTIGLVPTMGYLHEGHISLINRARKENDIVILSIFVNPTQFAPNEDLDKYPRDLDKDMKLAYDNGVDYIFAPTVEEMYGNNYSTYVNIEGDITKKLCGSSRPTHFKGVTTVVTKLFNITTPNNAYFGQKDAQQLSIIKKLVKELNFDINIVSCPIVRDKYGLALSSRNVYLSELERKQALVLSQSLNDIKSMYLSGNNNALELKKYIVDKISTMNLANIDYVEIVDFETFEDVDIINKQTLVALAVKFGNTRLIDNIILGE
ncbi:pantoate--beta-alanine ligase [Tissierella pigra]|uniref:Pantothenate synthetase n=1 Tax=Tissierella pigra TaxID=2607614 RepID=A0A6N7XLY7_9FIRM|nr:pantoate--beta-alanine ligase [Tissierella pigra]MBU5427347.1 pantoate--beta-alanine ligase [Tissierella pigra]MSU03059.1 pantoate--beta-alanine ligase [Tissierella pigra]